MRELVWCLIARYVARPTVHAWLIEKSTPYTHIYGPDESLYMGRWWLFNPYRTHGGGTGRKWADWLPSVRLHHIVRPDADRHLHDHPWNARTIILKGWYIEERPVAGNENLRTVYRRGEGYTGRLLFGQYHRISKVSEKGVWTLFITWRKKGTWGFLVDGKKVPWREYLGETA